MPHHPSAHSPRLRKPSPLAGVHCQLESRGCIEATLQLSETTLQRALADTKLIADGFVGYTNSKELKQTALTFSWSVQCSFDRIAAYRVQM